ncbi:hypothetical protein [Massilia putida]|uniref:hypothetical protein n=1 Tax=Massilia putida TaxID=1141883 RepID=UPI000952EBEB|nr:hypothetical protein [Massilia putida]
MAENIDTERAAFEAWASLQNWIVDRNSFGEYRHGTARDGWDAWQAARRTPSASIGEDGLPELSESRVIALWNSTESGGMVGRYVRFARAVARDAVAADRRARAKSTKTDVETAETRMDTAFGPRAHISPQASQGVKTWQERDPTLDKTMIPGAVLDELDDLRAQLARQSQPVAWLEAEPSARGRPVHEVVLGMVYSSRIHTRCAPMTSNPVWPLYAAPPLSSEQQPKKGDTNVG